MYRSSDMRNLAASNPDPQVSGALRINTQSRSLAVIGVNINRLTSQLISCVNVCTYQIIIIIIIIINLYFRRVLVHIHIKEEEKKRKKRNT